MWSHKTGSRRGQVVARPVLTVHTHIKELLALNTVHVPVFLHTRTQQIRVAPDEKI